MRLWRNCALLAVLSVPLFAATSDRSATLVINHVAIVDVNRGIILADRAVTIRETRIVKVEPAHRFSSRPDLHIIDATGKFLIPGLWDMHVHMFNNGSQRPANLWYLPFFVATGVTGIREMWTNPDEVAEINEWRRGVAAGTLIAPRIGAAGTLVDGPNGQWSTAPVVRDENEARNFVRMEKASGLDFVKVYTSLSREAYFAIADESRKQGIPFAGHLPSAVRAEEASAAGQKTFEHPMNILESCSSREEEWIAKPKMTQQERVAVLDSLDEQKCQSLMATMVKNSTWWVPTLVIRQTLSSPDPETFAARDEMKFIPVAERALWHKHAKDRESRRTPALIDMRQRFWNHDLQLVREMNAAGVPIMAGTDVSNDLLVPGFSLHDELQLFVTAGLSPAEALRTATLNPARFLNKISEFGTIEPGKFADLVLLDNNPLADIGNTRKIRAVILNGRFLDRSALDKILQQQAEAAARN